MGKLLSSALIGLCASLFIISCESMQYLKSEVSGNAKPTGGVQEQVPTTMTYNIGAQSLRRAVLEVLEEQDYIYEDNPSTGTIKTEPKPLGDPNQVGFLGAQYYAKLFIKLDGSKVTYRAKFDKKSNLTMGEQNVEFPEKENELRKDFFGALNKKLGLSPGISAAKQPTGNQTRPENISSQMPVIDIQKRLQDLGYNPGPTDGKFGKRTADALRKFQEDNSLPPTGNPDGETISKLRN